MTLKADTAREAAARSRIRMAGQLEMVDASLQAAEYCSGAPRLVPIMHVVAESHISEARRLLKEMLGAVEISEVPDA